MSKKIEYNKVVKIDTIKEMMELSVKDAAKIVAFKYRDEKDNRGRQQNTTRDI